MGAGIDTVLDSDSTRVCSIGMSAVGLRCCGGPVRVVSVMYPCSGLGAISSISTSSFNLITLDSPSGRDTGPSASSLTSAIATSSRSTGPWDR